MGELSIPALGTQQVKQYFCHSEDLQVEEPAVSGKKQVPQRLKQFEMTDFDFWLNAECWFSRAHQRPNLLAGDNLRDVSTLVQVEDDDGKIVVFAQGNGG